MNDADRVVRAVMRRWWIPILVVALALGSTVWITAHQELIYESRNLMVVKPSTDISSPFDISRSLEALERRSVPATFAKLASTLSILQSAAKALDMGEEVLKEFSVEGQVVPNRNMIQVEVRGPNPLQAAALANSVAQFTCAEAESLYRIFELEIVEEARPAADAVYPNPVRNYVVSGILSCFLGVLSAVVVDRLSAIRAL